MAEAQQQGGLEDLWKFLRTGKTMSAKDLAEAPDMQTLLNKARAEAFVEEDLPGVEPNSSDRTADKS